MLVNKLAAIDEFSKETNLNKELKVKIRNFVKTSSEFEGFRWADKKNAFFELPRNLRYEVAKVMYKGSANFLNFFKYQNSTFVSSVVPFLSHKVVEKDKFVYCIGDYADEVYFLLRGKVIVVSDEDSEPAEIFSLLPGGCFGDIEVIKKENRIYSVRSEAKCSLLAMNNELLGFIQHNFKSVWNELVSQAHENEKTFVALNKSIRKINKMSKDQMSIRNLKDINEYVDKLVKEEFNEKCIFKFDSGSPELKAEEYLQSIQNGLENIKSSSEGMNKMLDSIIDRLKLDSLSPVTSYNFLGLDFEPSVFSFD